MRPAPFGGMPPELQTAHEAADAEDYDFDSDFDDDDEIAPSARFGNSRSMTGGEILLADDDRDGRENLARGLRRLGYEVVCAPAAPRTAQLARSHLFRYAAIDVNARRGRGLDLIAEVRRQLTDVRIVAMVRHGTVETALDAMGQGAHFYLAKPVSAADLSNALIGSRRTPPTRASTLTLARVQWDHLQRILADCEGNVSETARRLGITRRTVQLKLKHGPPS
jgi:two-component system response regulator RegA